MLNLSVLCTDFLNSHVETLASSLLNARQTPAKEPETANESSRPPFEGNQQGGHKNLQSVGGKSLDPVATDLSSPALMAAKEGLSYRNILAPPSAVADLADSCDMTAQRKGEYLSIKVDDALVKNGISELAHSLIGKLSLAPGESPYSLDALYSKLSQVWGDHGGVTVSSFRQRILQHAASLFSGQRQNFG